MRFRYFDIKNFRGIDHVRISLDSIPEVSVYTLVGLNESGKTTILEAINYFSYKTDKLDSLELPGYAIKDPHSLIPIGKRSNFNGTMTLEVGLSFDEHEEEWIRGHLLEATGFSLKSKIGTLTIHQNCVFRNSKFDSVASKTLWTMAVRGSMKGERKIQQAQGAVWAAATSYIKQFIPPILYFPNFLFEFPDKIYLEETGNNDDKHAFYRLVIQDVLDSLDNGTNLDTHILQRAKSTDPNDRNHLDGLLLEMGRHITKSVFGSWDKIFHRKVGKKSIIVSAHADDNGHYYLQFRLEDSDGYYLINERSLGFRWFFVFLLLTQYRGFRNTHGSDPLFLFDEPASNLHPSAQSQLLDTFRGLAGQCRIIYTTHSHHMINPDWLESTFVIKNEGLDYQNDAEAFNSKLTSITATKYRDFVRRHPDQTHYYKPILDVLSFAPSRLDMVPDVVMLEGKNDYYTLRYMQSTILPKRQSQRLLPGTGAGTLDSLIRLYLAWGREFIVLLDSDKEGKKQRARYLEMFGPVLLDRIFTLKDSGCTGEGSSMEDLFDKSELLAIQQRCYPGDIKFEKTHFFRAIQELLAKGEAVTLSDATKEKFSELTKFLDTKLSISSL